MKKPENKTFQKKDSFLLMFNELQKVNGGETLTHEQLVYLLKAKSYSDLENHPDIKAQTFFEALNLFISHDKNDLEKRQVSAMKLLTMFNFQDQEKILTENQRMFSDMYRNEIDIAYNLAMQNPQFVLSQKTNIIKSYQKENDDHYFKTALKKSLSENTNEMVLRALIMENSVLESEYSYGNKKIRSTNDKIEKALLRSELKKLDTEKDSSNLMADIYTAYYADTKEIDNIAKAARKQADNILKANKSVIQNTELLSLIQSRKKVVEPDTACKYLYAIKHKKRCDYLESQNIHYESDYNPFKGYSSKSILDTDKNKLFNKISNGYAVNSSPHKKIVIQDIVSKLLVDDAHSKIFINFGSKVEASVKFDNAFIALEEMKSFLLEAQVFTDEKELITHIRNNFNVEGVDINELIDKAFPVSDLEMNIQADKTEKITLEDHIRMLNIEYSRLETDEDKQKFINTEINNIKETIKDKKHFNFEQTLDLFKTLDGKITPDNFEETLETLRKNNGLIELGIIKDIRKANTVVPAIPAPKTAPVLKLVEDKPAIIEKPEPIAEPVKVETPVEKIKVEKSEIDYINERKIDFPESIVAIDLIASKLEIVDPEYKNEVLEKLEIILTKGNKEVSKLSDKEYILFDDNANADLINSFNGLVDKHNANLSNTVAPVIKPAKKVFNSDEELNKILKTLNLVLASTDKKVISEHMEKLIIDRSKVNANVNARYADFRKFEVLFPELKDVKKISFDSKKRSKEKLDITNYDFGDNQLVINTAKLLIKNHNVRAEIDTQLPELEKKRKPKPVKTKIR